MSRARKRRQMEKRRKRWQAHNEEGLRRFENPMYLFRRLVITGISEAEPSITSTFMKAMTALLDKECYTALTGAIDDCATALEARRTLSPVGVGYCCVPGIHFQIRAGRGITFRFSQKG